MTGMSPGVILGPAAVIDQDVPCQQCGYNPRTLRLPGRCPECGTELEPSVREFALRRHELLPPDPQWARKIRAGAGLALVALALMVLPLYLPRQLFGMPFRNAPL